jgi:ABC-2 type transport system permease protein
VSGSSLSVVRGVAVLNLRSILKGPAKLLPPLLVPLFFFVAFKGALSGVGDAKGGFGYYDFTAFVFVLILYMAAMFVGAFTSFDIVDAYDSGLGRRLMAGAPRRMAIVFGFLIVNIGRCLLGMALVWGVVLATGMPVRGGPLDIAAIVGLGLLLNLATFFYGAGIALRIRSFGAGTLVLIPLIVVLFLTPIFTPRDQLTGFAKAGAGVNPITAALEAGRGFLANDPVSVALAFGVCAGLVVVSFFWAVRGMRSAERAG